MPTKTFRCLLGLLTFSLGGLFVLGGWSRNTWAQSTPSASVAQQETTAATPLESTSAASTPGDADAQPAEEVPTYPPLAEKYLRAVEATFGDPPGMTRLDPHSRVWVDRQKKRLVVDGYIALNAGQLEMFACLVGTKEHESVVAVFSKALVVHAGLLAIGAEPGHPVRWEPQFEPPTGSEIQVFVLWKDKEGKKRHTDARLWVRQVGTEDKTLESNWVFAGSSFWKDPDTGKEVYMAEGGDLICVSNFSTATLDVPFESSQVNAGLMFAAFTERIPERGTPVRLVLQLVNKKPTPSTPSPTSPSPDQPPRPSNP